MKACTAVVMRRHLQRARRLLDGATDSCRVGLIDDHCKSVKKSGIYYETEQELRVGKVTRKGVCGSRHWRLVVEMRSNANMESRGTCATHKNLGASRSEQSSGLISVLDQGASSSFKEQLW